MTQDPGSGPVSCSRGGLAGRVDRVRVAVQRGGYPFMVGLVLGARSEPGAGVV